MPAKKKTPAQLQREIDEALSGSGGTAQRSHATRKRPTYLRGADIAAQGFRIYGPDYSKLSDAELDAKIADIVAGPTVGPGAFKPGQRVTCSYRGDHVGKVLAVDDPRAWANTIAFPQDRPNRRAVKEHVLRHPTAAVDTIPVLYKFGVQWDSRDCLSPANSGKRSHATKSRAKSVTASKPTRGRSHATKARRSVRDRILDKIEQYSGTTSTGLVAADLRLSSETVKRHVAALIKEGLVQYGYDGNALELTAEAHRERAIDRRVASHR